MKTDRIIGLLFLGFVMWFVPLVASLGLFDRSGKLAINYTLLKSLICVAVATLFERNVNTQEYQKDLFHLTK